jgi:flagellar protein FlbD
MIQLTRLNNTRLAVNCDLIKYVEEAPDTVITLLNGEKLVVRETTAEVIECVRQFRRAVLTGEPCPPLLLVQGGVRSSDFAAHSDLSTEGPLCG